MVCHWTNLSCCFFPLPKKLKGPTKETRKSKAKCFIREEMSPVFGWQSGYWWEARDFFASQNFLWILTRNLILQEFRKVVLLHTLKCETMPCMGKGSQSHGNMMLNSFSVLPPRVRVSSESFCCFLVIRQWPINPFWEVCWTNKSILWGLLDQQKDRQKRLIEGHCSTSLPKRWRLPGEALSVPFTCCFAL